MITRKALVVGIDHYAHFDRLYGCANDARAVEVVLQQHGDLARQTNFGVKLLAAETATGAISRGTIKDEIADLFADDWEVALLYFAGHGHIETTGGYLCDSECKRGDDGLSLAEVLTLANESKAKNKVIVLDCCHSGVAGTPPGRQNAELSQGMTILAASTEKQYASEANGRGLFTTLLVDALGGAASNIVGEVTPGSVYAHVDQSLGPWAQRPVFKTNVKSFVSLRRVEPPIGLADIRRVTGLFPSPAWSFQLDPSFEPELRGRPDGAPPPNPVNTEKFAILQKYNRVNLLVPVGAPHMWHAAMESKSCRLTVLGEHYRRLVKDGLI